MAALEAWSPGAGADWARFLGDVRRDVARLGAVPDRPAAVAAAAARARRSAAATRATSARAPWHTLRELARGDARDPRLRMVIERFATYAGADPRRAPAALAVAGYVEHAFGAWHVRGGLHRDRRGLAERLAELGGGAAHRRARRGARARGARA